MTNKHVSAWVTQTLASVRGQDRRIQVETLFQRLKDIGVVGESTRSATDRQILSSEPPAAPLRLYHVVVRVFDPERGGFIPIDVATQKESS